LGVVEARRVVALNRGLLKEFFAPDRGGNFEQVVNRQDRQKGVRFDVVVVVVASEGSWNHLKLLLLLLMVEVLVWVLMVVMLG